MAMTMTTPMPRASSASVIPDHDSVEDFASPLKKFKVVKDLVGEEHSTDSAMELTEEEAFRIWCKVQRKEYPNNNEKQSRFEVFQSNLVKTPFTPIPGALTYPSLADRTKDEFEEFCEKYQLHKYDQPMNNNISFEEIIFYRDYMLTALDKVENENDFAKLEDLVGEEDNTPGSAAAAAMELTEEEAFRIWCKVQRKEYPNNNEKQSRFEVFQSNLVKTPFTPTPGALTYPSLADRTKDEFEEFCEKYQLHKYDQPMNNNISFEEIIFYRDYMLTTFEMPEDKDNTPFPTHLY